MASKVPARSVSGHGFSRALIHWMRNCLEETRHLYLDLDKDAARKLEAVRQDHAVPPPNYVLNTPPGKYRVIWRVQGVHQHQAEAMLRTLAQRFGGDPAATDSTRIFRLPGFNNKKYPDDFR
jgi:hypothetical protein